MKIILVYKIYRREEWNAKKRTTEPSKLELPMDWVLIGHTVTRLCDYFVSFLFFDIIQVKLIEKFTL